MRVLFRVDASSEIGSGHAMRCLTLAQALRRAGAEPTFACRSRPGDLVARIVGRGFAVDRLPDASAQADASGPPHARWLGTSWELDAEATARVCEARRPDWLVVDHYGIDARWHRALRASVPRIMAIDDLADRVLDCDLLLDQNVLDDADRYASKVPPDCRLLLGPRYALLQPEYAALRRPAPRSGAVRRVLVYFGATDAFGLVPRTCSALSALAIPELAIDVVGKDPAIPGSAGRVRTHRELPTLAPLIAASDIVVGSGSSGVWERICLGVPSVVVAVAENQVAISEALARAGLVEYLGRAGSLTQQALESALARRMSRGTPEGWMGDRRDLVDGEGCGRVVAALCGTRGEGGER